MNNLLFPYVSWSFPPAVSAYLHASSGLEVPRPPAPTTPRRRRPWGPWPAARTARRRASAPRRWRTRGPARPAAAAGRPGRTHHPPAARWARPPSTPAHRRVGRPRPWRGRSGGVAPSARSLRSYPYSTTSVDNEQTPDHSAWHAPIVSGGREATIHEDDLPGHVVRCRAGEEDRHPPEVGNLAVAADHRAAGQGGAARRVGGHRAGQRRRHEARRDGVGAHAVARPRLGL